MFKNSTFVSCKLWQEMLSLIKPSFEDAKKFWFEVFFPFLIQKGKLGASLLCKIINDTLLSMTLYDTIKDEDWETTDAIKLVVLLKISGVRLWTASSPTELIGNEGTMSHVGCSCKVQSLGKGLRRGTIRRPNSGTWPGHKGAGKRRKGTPGDSRSKLGRIWVLFKAGSIYRSTRSGLERPSTNHDGRQRLDLGLYLLDLKVKAGN